MIIFQSFSKPTNASSWWPSHCWTLFKLGKLFPEEPKLNLMGRMEAVAKEGKRMRAKTMILLEVVVESIFLSGKDDFL